MLPTPSPGLLDEKEVSEDSERPLVASVFVNRLAQGMPLATDPTVIYAALLEDRWRGTIYASDLQSPSPYNTYKHTGLPPGPICQPRHCRAEGGDISGPNRLPLFCERCCRA